MFEEQCEGMEKRFREYQGPPLNRKEMKGLLTEVKDCIKQFGNESRLTILREEILHSLGQS